MIEGRILIDDKHKNGQFGPGTVEYYPAIDTGNRSNIPPMKIDKRQKKEKLEEQQVITLDAKMVAINTTIMYSIPDPVSYLLNSVNPLGYTKLLFQANLRDIATRNNFIDLVQNKKKLCEELRVNIVFTQKIKF